MAVAARAHWDAVKKLHRKDVAPMATSLARPNIGVPRHTLKGAGGKITGVAAKYARWHLEQKHWKLKNKSKTYKRLFEPYSPKDVAEAMSRAKTFYNTPPKNMRIPRVRAEWLPDVNRFQHTALLSAAYPFLMLKHIFGSPAHYNPKTHEIRVNPWQMPLGSNGLDEYMRTRMLTHEATHYVADLASSNLMGYHNLPLKCLTEGVALYADQTMHRRPGPGAIHSALDTAGRWSLRAATLLSDPLERAKEEAGKILRKILPDKWVAGMLDKQADAPVGFPALTQHLVDEYRDGYRFLKYVMEDMNERAFTVPAELSHRAEPLSTFELLTLLPPSTMEQVLIPKEYEKMVMARIGQFLSEVPARMENSSIMALASMLMDCETPEEVIRKMPPPDAYHVLNHEAYLKMVGDQLEAAYSHWLHVLNRRDRTDPRLYDEGLN